MNKKRSVLLLISAIIGVAYMAYSIWYWGGSNLNTTSDIDAVSTGLATALVFPHLLCAGLAVIFNILGWVMNHRGFALTGGILYAVAMVLFPMYFIFTLIEMILSFVGFARLKKLNAVQKPQE